MENNENIDKDSVLALMEYDKMLNTFTKPKFAKVFMDAFNQYLTDSGFYKFKKKTIVNWLENPNMRNDKKVIDASNYFYRVSNHYRRIVNYPSYISCFDYIVTASEINKDDIYNDKELFKKSFLNTLKYLKSMNIKQEFTKISQICFKEDVFYGYVYETENNGSFYIKKLDPKYCRLFGITDGCLTFEFNFSYFDLKIHSKPNAIVQEYGDEFVKKYNEYKNDGKKWRKIDLINSICIKFEDNLSYILPPFIGILPDLFDLQAYKAMKKANENLGNYNLLSMSSPLNKEGKPTMTFNELKKYYEFMSGELPEGVGLAISPTKLEQYKFDKAGQSTADSVADATDAMWSSAGISPLLFSSDKSGSAIINSSIELDSTYVYSMYRKFERWINYRLKMKRGSCSFRIKFLDTTIFNRKDKLKSYLELGTYGFPVVSQIAALSGIDMNDVDFLVDLEQEIFNFGYRLKPLTSSHVQSSNTINEIGRPKEDVEDLTEAGVKTRERDDSE